MRLTCRATKAAVGAEITSVLRQVDRMMHSVGRRYYQRRRWGRMRPRDWLVLFPDWPCAAPEIAVDEGKRLGVLSVLPADEFGQWLSVDYEILGCRISDAEKDLPRWLGDRLAENATHAADRTRQAQDADHAAHGPDGALGETGRPGPVRRWPPVAVDADQLHAGRLAVTGRGKGGQEPADRGAARCFKPPDGRRELQVGPPQVARGQPAPRRMLRVRGDRRGAGPLLARQGDAVGGPVRSARADRLCWGVTGSPPPVPTIQAHHLAVPGAPLGFCEVVDAAPTAKKNPAVDHADMEAVVAEAQWAGTVVFAPLLDQAERGGQVGGGRFGAEGNPALVPPHDGRSAA